MFRDAASGEISERYEAVRFLIGDDETKAGGQFCDAYDVDMTPTLLALGPDGRHLARKHGNWFEDVSAVLRFMAEAEREYQRVRAEERRLLAATDVGSRRALAVLYVRHFLNGRAQPLLEELVRTSPRPLEHVLLVSVLDRLNDVPAYRAALGTVIAEYPDDPARIFWEVQLALAAVPRDVVKGEARVQRHREQVRALEGLLERATAKVDRAVVHGAIAKQYEHILWFPEAPADAGDRMVEHHARLLQDAVLDPRRVDLLLLVGHALDWAEDPDRALVTDWLETAAKVPDASVTPFQAADLWSYRTLFRRRLAEGAGDGSR